MTFFRRMLAKLWATSSGRVLQDLYRNVLRSWQPLVLLQLFLKAASVLVLTPMTAAVANLLLTQSGSSAVANTALLSFALSVPGVLTLLLLPSLILATVYVDQACTLSILEHREETALGAIWLTLRRAFHLCLLAVTQVAIFLLCVTPLAVLAALTYWSLLGDVDINYYLETWPPKFLLTVAIGLILLGIAGLVYVALTLRWLVALPLVVLDAYQAWTALRVSATRMRGHYRTAAILLSSWLLARFSTGALLLLAFTWFTDAVLSSDTLSVTTALLVTTTLLAINVGSVAVLTGLDAVLTAMLIQGFYHVTQATPEEELPVRTKVLVATDSARTAMFSGGLASAFVAGLLSWNQVDQMLGTQHVIVTAHRAGMLRAPENSLAALRLAIDEGADYAEIDVQRSTDGTVYVVHDRDLLRIAGQPLVISRARDEQLSRVRLYPANNVSGAAEEPLATLQQFMDAAKGKIKLCIELKYYGFDEPLAAKVVTMIEENGLADEASVISLEYPALMQVRSLNPKLRLGYLISASVGDATRMDVDFLSIQKSRLTRDLRERATAQNLEIAVWTVDNYDEMISLMVAGADEIVTNDPQLGVQAAEDYQEFSEVELLLLRIRQAIAQ